MSTIKNTLLALAAVTIVVLIVVSAHLGAKKALIITTTDLSPTTPTPAYQSYKPITLELLPNRSVKIAQGRHRVTYNQRKFNRLHYKLRDCFERRKSCSAKPGDNSCPYFAYVVGIELCLGKQRQVLGARAGEIKLHREDLLQIYEL